MADTDPNPAAEWVSIDAIKPWKGNPRQSHETQKIAQSIKRVGWGAPMLINADGRLIGGHGRLKAAAILQRDFREPKDGDDPGQWHEEARYIAEHGKVPARYKDLDDRDANWLALADNKHTENAEWEQAALADVLSEYSLEEAEIAGWSSKELEKLADSVPGFGPLEMGEDEDDDDKEEQIPDPPKNPVTKSGDVWVLGEHMLICGDCRTGAVAQLLGDERANIVFTSPPYASQRKYDEASGFKPIHPDKYVDWWEAVQAAVRDMIAPDGSFFVNIKEAAVGLDRQLYVFDLVLAMVRLWGWHLGDVLCWQRPGFPGKPHRRLKNQWEPVYQFALGDWKFCPDHIAGEGEVPSGAGVDIGPSGRFTRGYRGTESELIGTGTTYPGNRIGFGSEPSGGHPAAFPSRLPEFFLRAYTDEGDVALDPFCGSGSTIIACERNGRKGRGIEISPAYCDVIVERWENETGGKAERGPATAPDTAGPTA